MFYFVSPLWIAETPHYIVWLPGIFSVHYSKFFYRFEPETRMNQTLSPVLAYSECETTAGCTAIPGTYVGLSGFVRSMMGNREQTGLPHPIAPLYLPICLSGLFPCPDKPPMRPHHMRPGSSPGPAGTAGGGVR